MPGTGKPIIRMDINKKMTPKKKKKLLLNAFWDKNIDTNQLYELFYLIFLMLCSMYLLLQEN